MKLRRTSVISVALLLGIGHCAAPLRRLVRDDAWSTFRGDRRNSGAARETVTPPLELTTFLELPQTVRSTVAANGHDLFIGDWTGTIRCLDLLSDSIKWEAHTRGFLTGSPTLVRDRLLIGSCDSSLYAFSLVDGRMLWRVPTGMYVISTPQVAGDLAVFGSNDFSVYGVDWRSGEVRWRVRTGGLVSSTAALSRDRLYVGSGDSLLYCLRIRNGEVLWRYHSGGTITASPLLVENTLYFGNYAGWFTALGLDGRLRWRVRCPSKIDASATYADGVVFWADMAGNLYAARAGDGTPVWQLSLGSPIVSSPLVDGAHLYVARHSPGRIYMLRQKDGAVLWSFGLQGDVYASPVIHRGQLFIGTEKGRFYGFRSRVEAGVE